jgi:SAM-dependent methyltransferase
MTPREHFPGYGAEAEVYDYCWSLLVEDVGIALARAGWEVDGIDRSAEMLRVARSKRRRLPSEVRERVRFHQGDLTEFRSPGRFDAAVIAVDSYPLILSRPNRVRALRNVRRHLKASGKLLLHIDTPRSYETARVGAPTVSVFPIDRGRRLYLRSLVESFVRPDLVRGITAHLLVDRAGRIERHFTSETRTRVLPIRSVVGEIADAGFARSRLFGDYAGGRLTLRSSFAVIEASA